MKEKLKELRELYIKAMNLQYQINKEFSNKPISVDLSFKRDWSGAGYNPKIDKVDIRVNDVGITYTVFDGDEEIECVDGLSFNQFIQYAELA